MVVSPTSLALLATAVVALSACVQDPQVRPDAPRTAVGAASAPYPGDRRGIVECWENQACGAPKGRAVRSLRSPLPAEDVAIRFQRVAADGQRQALDNGSALGPGEQFVILLQARREAHVYLWHADQQGRLVELLSASGKLGSSRDCARANRLSAGQGVQLSYTIDPGTGSERIYPVVSAAPLCETDPTGPSRRLGVGAGAACPGPAGTCGKVFVIRRIGKA